MIFRTPAEPADMKEKFESVWAGTYEESSVRMSDTVKQTTPDQGSQSDPIQWEHYMRMNKRNPSWKRFLQARRFIDPWATKSRGRDFFKGGRFVTTWILPFSFSEFFLGFIDLVCFSMSMWFWNMGRSCLPRFYSGLSPLSSSQDHEIFILDLI